MKSYLTRTQRGERKRRGKEQTPTHENLAQNGQPWKGKGKEKRRPTEKRNKTSGGGGGQKRLNQPDTAKTYNNLSTQRAKTYLERGETQETHEIGTHGELVNGHDASTTHAKFVIRLKGPRLFKSQPSGRLTCFNP